MAADLPPDGHATGLLVWITQGLLGAFVGLLAWTGSRQINRIDALERQDSTSAAQVAALAAQVAAAETHRAQDMARIYDTLREMRDDIRQMRERNR